MSQAAHPQTDPTQDAHYYRRVLHDLIEIGADLARLLHQQARAQTSAPGPNQNPNLQSIPPETAPPSPPAFDPTIPFDRVARTIRRTIMLAQKLAEPAPAHTAPDPRAAARKRIIRAVEDNIQRRAKPGDETERLNAELLDRMDEPDLDDDIATRPVDEIIQDICHDLGLDNYRGSHPWKRRTPADIAILTARAANKKPPEAQAPDPKIVVPMRPAQQSPTQKTPGQPTPAQPTPAQPPPGKPTPGQPTRLRKTKHPP